MIASVVCFVWLCRHLARAQTNEISTPRWINSDPRNDCKLPFVKTQSGGTEKPESEGKNRSIPTMHLAQRQRELSAHPTSPTSSLQKQVSRVINQQLDCQAHWYGSQTGYPIAVKVYSHHTLEKVLAKGGPAQAPLWAKAQTKRQFIVQVIIGCVCLQ